MTTIYVNGSYSTFVTTILSVLAASNNDKRDKRDNHAMMVGMEAVPKSNKGLWMEFGVFRGKTLSMMAEYHAGGTVHGFDSFRGLPEKWRNGNKHDKGKYTKSGAFALQGRPPHMKRPNVNFHVGLFNETLDVFLAQNLGVNIDFLHIDCDLFSSTRYVLTRCGPRLKPGSVIVFDELVNFPEYTRGELLALHSELRGLSLRLLGHSLKYVVKNPTRDHWPQAVAFQVV